LQYPALRKSANNSKFQKNLRPRSVSRHSRTEGEAGAGNRSRSRSNLSKKDPF